MTDIQTAAGPVTALRDDWIMRSMLSRVGDIPETVLLPVLRLVADDRRAVDDGWAAVIAKRKPNRLFESPRKSWQRRYGQFVYELEWASSELVRFVPRAEVEELVSSTVATRLRRWLRYLLPMFNAVRLVPPGLHPTVMDAGVGVATFLVGPIHRTGVEPDGTVVYEIPECAMHTSVGTQSPQENSCLMACKAACEKVFDANSAMPLEFDPHLPGLSCTLRVRPAGPSTSDPQ
ncbi:hypothetical protein [Mycobacterium sp. 1274756.6]|uniref:hypothetical protein n=1 Tax=Mycobacterium sp. 1274756.6 TaxID=1834076 RepID=UPI00080251EF|nr:hypothetical protein [Mycobacterium sp. 1274756.6]OBJ73990.1 hypothetical protein A5643_02370 [Mycobacterium sp. 1274756.6]